MIQHKVQGADFQLLGQSRKLETWKQGSRAAKVCQEYVQISEVQGGVRALATV